MKSYKKIDLLLKKLESIGLRIVNKKTYFIMNIGDREYTMDIKFASKNVFVERYIENRNGTHNGWFKLCGARLICFIDDKNDIAYILDWAKLKKFLLKEGKDSKYYRRVYDKRFNGYKCGYLLSLEFLRENDYIFKCIILEE